MDAQLFYFVLLGMGFGAIGGLLGTGGGTFAIPFLVVVFGYNQQFAQGTVLVMVVLNVIKGLMKYRKLSGLNIESALLLAVSGSIAATAAAHISLQIPSAGLRHLYGLFL